MSLPTFTIEASLTNKNKEEAQKSEKIAKKSAP